MNCGEFDTQWNALVSNALAGAERAAMVEHAAACATCGKRLREHEELRGHSDAVLSAKRLRAGLADSITEDAYLERFRTPINLKPAMDPSEPAKPLAPISLLMVGALLVGLGYFAGAANGGGSDAALTLALLRAGAGGGGGGRWMSSGALGWTGVGGVSEVIRLVFFLFLLLWMTRTELWKAIFPTRLPAGLVMARRMAVPVAVCGVIYSLLTLWLGLGPTVGSYLFGTFQGYEYATRMSSYAQGSDASAYVAAMVLLSQLWSIGFWCTLFTLLFGVLNPLLTPYVRQKA